MTWFADLTGIQDESHQQVHQHLSVDGKVLRSKINGQSWTWGELQVPTLSELRTMANSSRRRPARITVSEVVGDVQRLHQQQANAGSMFQVASQFNLLEMVSPRVTPEQGIGIYERDRTQGPACAIAAGAGTIYRNYFAPVNGQIGQTSGNQIDCLAELGLMLDNSGGRLWSMQNGYALATESGLAEITRRLQEIREDERDRWRQSLRIGIQWETQVTLGGHSHLVSQAYCSALPVAYSGHSAGQWSAFAKLILEAAYEATFAAAHINAERTGRNRLFLTLLGGGAFGNDLQWIFQAIERAMGLYRDSGLEVAIVSYGGSNPEVKRLADKLNARSW